MQNLKLSVNVLLILYFIFAIALLYFVPKESLSVDRWSVISSFWQNYFHNEYVYAAKSFGGNYPGPMPFYFILALPFYLMGELGLFSFLGITAFVLVIKKLNKSFEYTSISFLYIATSLFYIWEICARSNIFINGSLILFSILFFFKKYKKALNSNLIFGIIIGLLLSTRNVFVIPYIIAIIFALRTKKIDLENTFYLGIITLFIFSLTFLPFVWNHFADFKLMNPFIIQSSFLMPFKYTLLFIFIAFCLSFFCKEEEEVYFYSGLSLFLTILFYFGFMIFNYSFKTAYYESKADISYFILCLPFFIYHIFLNVKPKVKH
ncbi:MAG: oligosaccharide repeat unit polymerase [Flavobacteriaceae bacterium]|nr:oligosaccharide repeat unit polymerase [Flavobacteriaceae bacterium]